MKEPQINKEEMLMLLSEINDQLGEMEIKLQASLAELKSDMFADHAESLGHCESRIAALETVMRDLNNEKEIMKPGRTMSLELGC